MTVVARGIDYAWQHPDPAAIAKAGYVFACRYLSRDPSKNLTLPEAQALAARGIWVVANWEYGAQDMLRGYAGGIADAHLALAQATAAGMPAGRPIYFSADWDVTPTQEAAVLAYLSGAASVLGAGETGEYGGYYPVKAARDAGYAWTWQTFAWSGGQWDARDTIRQTGTAVVGGVQVDVNEAMAADYGQWQPGRLPAPLQLATPAEDDVNTFLISVKPDPTAPGGSGSGIFSTDGVNGAVHVDGGSLPALEARLGSPSVVTPQYYANLLANRAAISVDASALAGAVPTAEQIAAAVPAHLAINVAAK